MYEPSMSIDVKEVSDAVFFPYVPASVIPECYAVFQPIYDVQEEQLHSVEALIRHPQISTNELVTWAEQSGRLDQMFERMLMLTLPVIRELALPASLNISPTQLLSTEKLIKYLSPVVKPVNLSFQVSLEVTETVAITDMEQFKRSLTQLKNYGFKISLDDFGAGFAFFETLNMGYFDIIKLDRGLISDIHCITKKKYLVQSIALYAKGLGITVIAEGVEKKSEVDYLLSIGIIYMQGFYLSPPLSWDDLCSVVKNGVVPARTIPDEPE
ncbi:EAL domain-containing protein [Enterobacter cloacae complex sp. 2024EL-00215]|uniref:EAL domain-containing protein n=1 Tax=unclassified Enterobacter cloacae complex TaxID=2757714 RepID=UPI0037502AF2